jgi:hypothetical protein
MTLDAVIQRLTEMRDKEGVSGETPVIWDAISHSYSVELRLTTRNQKPVILVNA